MNTNNQTQTGMTLIAMTVAAILLAAGAAASLKPDGAAEARDKLSQLQSDPNLASQVPLAVKEADTAVRAAEQPEADRELGAYRVYIADRKVDIARAQAETSFAENQRAALNAQREHSRLDARTGATGNLSRLGSFLHRHPDRTNAMEGYTDGVGGQDYNQRLSERRAASVKSYLAGQDIGASLVSAPGSGENDPVAGNDSAAASR